MKTALITGASRGIGLVVAQHLLSTGWKVIGMSRTNSPIVHENYLQKITDIKDKNSVKSGFNELADQKIDLLINNSAICRLKPFEHMDDDLIDEMIDTNLKGTIWVTKWALPLMPANSRIIFMNSVSGDFEFQAQSVYCATKHGLRAFAGVLSKELSEKNIKVTSIHPGGVNTTLWNNLNPYPGPDVAKTIDPAEIARVITHILESGDNIEYKTVNVYPSQEIQYY